MAKLKLPSALGWRFGLAVLLLATLSLALGTQNAIDVNENTRCLATYAQRNAEVSKVRSAATADKDAAVSGLLDRVTKLILNPAAGEASNAKLRAAAERYRAEAIELQAKRAANPLPDFPQECKEVNR